MPLWESVLGSLSQTAPEQADAAVLLVTLDSASSASSASAEGRDGIGGMTQGCCCLKASKVQAPATVRSQQMAAAPHVDSSRC